jgi:hypothetical protein
VLGSADVHKLRWVEVFDFGGDVAGVGRGIEGCDIVHAGFAGDEVLPEGLLSDPDG